MRHVVLDVKNDCFVRHNDSYGLDDSSHAKKITCAGVRRMRGFGVVFTKKKIQRTLASPALVE